MPPYLVCVMGMITCRPGAELSMTFTDTQLPSSTE